MAASAETLSLEYESLIEDSMAEKSRHLIKRLAGRVAIILAVTSSASLAGCLNDANAEANGGYPWAGALDHDPAKYEWWLDENNNGTRETPGELMDPNGYYYRNCTSYVAWRVNKEFGVDASGLRNGGSWDNNANSKGFTHDTTPEPGDAAVWDSLSSNDAFGHVAFVESVNSDGSVNISEYNYVRGSFGMRNNVRAHHYVDFNGAGVGFSESTGGSGSSTLQMLKNSGNTVYALQNIQSGGWLQQTGAGTASQISAGGSLQMLIDGGGSVWAKNNNLSNGGWTQETAPGTATKISAGSNYQMLLTGNNAVYAKSAGNVGYGGWTQETPAGTAKAIATAGDKQMLINACDAVYTKVGPPSGGGWTQETGCGIAKQIAISDAGVRMILDASNAVYAKATYPSYGGWTQETPAGTAKAIAVGGLTQMIINACDAVYAKNDVSVGGWVKETECGQAASIAAGTRGLQMMRTTYSAVFAKIGVSYGGWTQETDSAASTAIDAG